MAMMVVEENNWQESKLKYRMADKWLNYTGNITTLEGRKRYSDYVKKLVSEKDDADEQDSTLELKLFQNGQGVTNRYKTLVDKFTVKMRKEMKKFGTEE